MIEADAGEDGPRRITLDINGRKRSVDVDSDTPLLFVLRDDLGLKGTKFGCLIGACGACTVLIDGAAARACVVPATAAESVPIATIESLAPAHPVIEAWVAEQVPQCGFCQPGMVMATAALLRETPHPTDADIDRAITNICRCGTYPRIRRAIHAAAARAGGGGA